MSHTILRPFIVKVSVLGYYQSLSIRQLAGNTGTGIPP